MKKLLIVLLLIGTLLPAAAKTDQFHLSYWLYKNQQALGTGDSPTFTGLTLSGSTASTVAYFNASKALTSLANGAGYLYNNGVGALSFTNPTSRSTTLTIASSTSKSQYADYVCDGTADEVQINTAIQDLDGLGGRIVLLEGTFYINAAITYAYTGTADNDIILEGQGENTILKLPNGHATSFSMIGAAGGSELATMANWTATDGWTYGAGVWTHSAGTTALTDDKSTAFVVGKPYKVIVGYTWVGAGSTIIIAGGGYAGEAIARAETTSVIYDFIATATTRLTVTPTTGFTGTITSVSIIPHVQNLTFKNFKLDGNKGSAIGNGTSYNGIALNGTDRVTIENVLFVNCTAGDAYGVFVQNSTNVLIGRCYFYDWATNGIETRSSDGVTVSNNIFDTSRYEIYSNSNRTNILNNVFIETGISAGTDVSSIDIQGLNIVGNMFRNLNLAGLAINIDNSDNVVISGNNVNSKHGSLTVGNDANRTSITNNIFQSNHASLVQIGGEDGIIASNQFIVNSAGGSALLIIGPATTGPSRWEVSHNVMKCSWPSMSGTAIDITRGTKLNIFENQIDNFATGINIAAAVVSIRVIDNIDGSNVAVTNLGTVATIGNVNRVTEKIKCHRSSFTGIAATHGHLVLKSIPAKTRVVSIISDTTQVWEGGSISACTLEIGKTTDTGVEYILAHDMHTAAITVGLADAELGESIIREHAVQGGDIPSWTASTNITATIRATGDNLTALSSGLTYVYITTETFE